MARNTHGRRIGVMGWSNGGYVVLDIVRVGRTEDYDFASEGFRAAVALYPECRFDIGAVFAAPLLVLIGGADDWTLASSCEQMARSSPSSEQIMLKVYPGAHHSFDAAGTPMHFLANVRNANKPGGCCGATLGWDPVAHADSITQVERFFGQYLKGGGKRE